MDRLLQQVSEFVAVVQDVWLTGVAGIDFGRIAIALAILLIFMVLRGLFTRFVLGFLRRIAARTATSIDDSLLNCIPR